MEGDDGKLKETISQSRRSVKDVLHQISTRTQEPIDRVKRFFETGSAHLDDGVKKLVALRHKSNPLVSMFAVSALVGFPTVKVAGPGTGLRLATIAFAATGLFVYPDYVTKQVLAWSGDQSGRESS